MARFVDTIDLEIPCEEAFDALVDFSRTADWDPSVESASRLDRGPIAPGSRFRVVVKAFGVRSALDYELVVAERPHRIVLRARKGALTSLDEITLAPRGDGVRVTYDARITLAGIAQLADPLLGAWFQRSGARSADGLRRALSRGTGRAAQPAKKARASSSSVSSRSGTRARSRAHSKKVPASLR
jgi:carbon monoxide dehydrogenase subunit G